MAPALIGEWQRLLDAVRQAPTDATPPEPLAVKIARGASLPRWPIEPNRVLLLWLGVRFWRRSRIRLRRGRELNLSPHLMKKHD